MKLLHGLVYTEIVFQPFNPSNDPMRGNPRHTTLTAPSDQALTLALPEL